MIKVFARETGFETNRVTADVAATHIAANDHLSGEAALIQGLREAEFEAPDYPKSIAGFELQDWAFDEAENCDVLQYA